jgi:hypothetical protein
MHPFSLWDGSGEHESTCLGAEGRVDQANTIRVDAEPCDASDPILQHNNCVTYRRVGLSGPNEEI